MKTIFKFKIILFCGLFFIFGCKKKNTEPENVIPSGIFGASKTAKVMGSISDESGQAIQGATVQIGNVTAQTDINGLFNIANATVYDKLGYVKVTKAGYFLGSRSFVPSNSGNVVNIRMLSKTIVATLSGSSGGTVQSQGVTLFFGANSFSKNNAPFTGQVNVALKHLDPESPFFEEEMPGNLVAVQDGEARGLTSYGMVAVELSDNTGAEIQIASGQTATVSFPVSSSMLSSAPSTIDLWSFDETNGYWKKEGQASLQGDVYTAQVTHFSFWNCDIPWDAIILNGRVKDYTGAAINGAKVTITSTNMGSASDFTNTNGNFSGYVPGNQTLTMSIQIICSGAYTTVYSTQIGPFTAATDLGDLQINNFLNSTIVRGSVVDCNNNLVASGSVTTPDGSYFVENGQFSFLACGSTISIIASTVFASSASQNFALSGVSTNVGTLQACNGNVQNGTVSDNNGHTYVTVQIGTQEWMAENLRTTKYANGDPIPNITDNTQWQNLTTGAWAHYNNDSQYENPYGKLYNWYTVDDPRNVCPTGWHVPSDQEWIILTTFLGGELVAGGKMKSSGTQYWLSPNQDATNESGFSGLPGGGRADSGPSFYIGEAGYWWSSTEYDTSEALLIYLVNDDGYVEGGDDPKEAGVSVRCLRD